MTGAIEIANASAGQVEDARQLFNESWIKTYSPIIGDETTRELIAKKHAAEVFARQALEPDHIFLVALDGDTVVGHVYGFPQDGFYIDRLHVKPTRKGQGIGRPLIDAVIARRPHGERLWLDVLLGNDQAMGFYGRVGFTRGGQTDACGGLAGIPAVIYEMTVQRR
ncbi:MAG: GNAT family N-acetyltransferase [Pseudomonadota bacterium]